MTRVVPSPSAAIATLFGIGHFPYAPGTLASAVALPLAAAIQHLTGAYGLILASSVATVAGLWASEHYVHQTGNADPSECVVDELAGQWLACALACLLVPFTISAYTAAFLLFRLLDITKLWPVSAAERAPGGIGVMLDDVAAGLMAGILVLLLRHFIRF
jgi:phosphatidylglycerophosphatase A